MSRSRGVRDAVPPWKVALTGIRMRRATSRRRSSLASSYSWHTRASMPSAAITRRRAPVGVESQGSAWWATRASSGRTIPELAGMASCVDQARPSATIPRAVRHPLVGGGSHKGAPVERMYPALRAVTLPRFTNDHDS